MIDDDQLAVPRVSFKMGERVFSVAAPIYGIVSLLRLKNLSLHSHFGKKLKT